MAGLSSVLAIISVSVSSTNFDASLLFGVCDCPAGFTLRELLRFSSVPLVTDFFISLR